MSGTENPGGEKWSRAESIGKNCVIKPGVEIVNSVIGPDVHIEEKASVKNSVIWSHTRVASSANVQTGTVTSVGTLRVVGDQHLATDSICRTTRWFDF